MYSLKYSFIKTFFVIAYVSASFASGNLILRNHTFKPMIAVVDATSGVQKDYGQTSQRCYRLNPEPYERNRLYPWLESGASFDAHYAPIKGNVKFFEQSQFEGGLQRNPLAQCEVTWRNETPVYEKYVSLLPEQDNIVLTYPEGWVKAA